MQIFVISYGQVSAKSSTNLAGDDMNLNMIENSLFYGTERDKDILDDILVNNRICSINQW